jgi:adenylosuccinate synthase
VTANGVVVVGAQWGAEGKGRIADMLAGGACAVVRYQGGPNTGHTVVTDDGEFRLQSLPAGVIRGQLSIIGNGCVLDPCALVNELDAVAAAGLREDVLRISRDAHIVLPYHRLYDGIIDEGRDHERVGTTRQGMGPCYADKALRLGVRAGDLLADDLVERIERVVEPKRQVLGAHLDELEYDIPSVAERYAQAGNRLAAYICDTRPLVWDALEAGTVLFEGAQGTMLDLDHGTYPWVSSSNATAGGACTGSGAPPGAIGDVWGAMKPYVTRVGGGPFPTELSDDVGSWLQERGREWGTTTGRRRRCGWLDLPELKQAIFLNGINRLAVNKLDVLSGLETIKVATAYRTAAGELLDTFRYDRDEFVAMGCDYVELEGWSQPIAAARSPADLPSAARDLLDFITERTGVPIAVAGVGPHREQVVAFENPATWTERNLARCG